MSVAHSGSSLAHHLYPPTLPGVVVPRGWPPWVPAGSVSPCQAWPPWRVARCVTDTGAWWRLLGGVHMSPTGVGSAVMCASSSFRRSAGTGLHCCPPAACVVSCTPCRVVQQCCAPLGVPGGVPPVRGAPWLYGCNWQACGYTLAGLPLERSVAHSPRCAALQQCCSLPQLCAGTLLGFFGLPGGYLGCYCRG